ncbi:hypothetical protein Lal_00042898 [Lupinus albus]|nr:hypothetical protein Lal_00042898 [Lupinus albus]
MNWYISTSKVHCNSKLILAIEVAVRLNALIHEYELFRMFPNQSIGDMQKRFTHIVNHLVALDKTFSKGELTNKPRVTVIMESKYLYSMALETLFGKLQEHEMDLGHLTLHEESDKRKKRISLKNPLLKIKKMGMMMNPIQK